MLRINNLQRYIIVTSVLFTVCFSLVGLHIIKSELKKDEHLKLDSTGMLALDLSSVSLNKHYTSIFMSADENVFARESYRHLSIEYGGEMLALGPGTIYFAQDKKLYEIDQYARHIVIISKAKYAVCLLDVNAYLNNKLLVSGVALFDGTSWKVENSSKYRNIVLEGMWNRNYQPLNRIKDYRMWTCKIIN